MGNENTVVIIGAGFSKATGLPFQREIATRIIEKTADHDLYRVVTKIIREFPKDAFGWAPGNAVPALEDIFTIIDLSTNSGHNLGVEYPPKKLRALRRIITYRVFQVLDEAPADMSKVQPFLGKLLDGRRQNVGFIVLNWDIVLENALRQVPGERSFDYCVGAIEWNNQKRQKGTVKTLKVHGSSNWVYCDNCRNIFYDEARKLSLTVRVGIRKDDFLEFDDRSFRADDSNFDDMVGVPREQRSCRPCHAEVGPHIATFSFRKSFRTHAFAETWRAAEIMLSDAQRWVFAGYSLPSADVEFKHLLKTCELKYGERKQIEVILKCDKDAAKRYESLFGKGKLVINQEGVERY